MTTTTAVQQRIQSGSQRRKKGRQQGASIYPGFLSYRLFSSVSPYEHLLFMLRWDSPIG